MQEMHANGIWRTALWSEDPGPTEKGEKSDVIPDSNLSESTPACEGSEHLGAGLFLFEDTAAGEEGT
jgi:hypothetical protein